MNCIEGSQATEGEGRAPGRTAGYLRDLLKIFGVQVTLFVAMVAQRADSMPPISRLMAATTISQALPETFLLVVCMRDVIKLNLKARQAQAVGHAGSFVCLPRPFSLFVLYVYLVELQSENMSARQTDRTVGSTGYRKASSYPQLPHSPSDPLAAARRHRSVSKTCCLWVCARWWRISADCGCLYGRCSVVDVSC